MYCHPVPGVSASGPLPINVIIRSSNPKKCVKNWRKKIGTKRVNKMECTAAQCQCKWATAHPQHLRPTFKLLLPMLQLVLTYLVFKHQKKSDKLSFKLFLLNLVFTYLVCKHPKTYQTSQMKLEEETFLLNKELFQSSSLPSQRQSVKSRVALK